MMGVWKSALRQLRKTMGFERSEMAFTDQILRLAEIAPHLLEDIGFVRVHPMSPGIVSSWRRDGVSVHLGECGRFRVACPEAQGKIRECVPPTLHLVSGERDTPQSRA